MTITPNTLTIEILEDGTIKTNATKMYGTEAGIVAALTDLAKEVGGELTVEKHEPGLHHHHHGDGRHHTHGKG